MHAFFAGGLDVPFPAVVFYLNCHKFLGLEILVCPAAGGDEEFLVRKSGADVSPGPGDEPLVKEFKAGG